MQLRPYQAECKQAFYDYYTTGSARNGLIVVPTAGGKSLIIGDLATDICKKWPGQRILIMSHVQELIRQNHEKVKLCWNTAPAGIYSAALNLREAHMDIVTAMVQSVHRIARQIGHRDLMFIDEAHLLQKDGMGMYGRLIGELLKINPCMRICGFTATDYRLDSGSLTEGEGAIFNDVIIDIPIQRLLEEGYLCPPISKSSLVQADLVGVSKLGGEFNTKEMAERFDQRAFMDAALDNDMPYLKDRKCIAQFCATIENANHLCQAMNIRGIQTEVVHGDKKIMPTEQREDIFRRLNSGKLRGVCSVGVMTTGTDIPNIDCIGLWRATQSPGLYQQIIGRGFRVIYAQGFSVDTDEQRRAAIAAGPKPNFLVLDHGANIERHGAITNVQKPIKKEKGSREKIPPAKVRICEVCRSAWPLEVFHCGTCGHEMKKDRDVTANLELEASNASILGTAFDRGERAEWFSVDNVRYSLHVKKDEGSKTLKVSYQCGLMEFPEWYAFPGAIKTFRFWGSRTTLPLPKNVDEAMRQAKNLTKPRRIMVSKNKKTGFYTIQQVSFQGELNVHAQ